MTDLDSKVFVDKLIAKDQQAYRTLVESTQHMVVNVAFRFVADRETAEDIAQDVYIEVYNSIHRFEQKSKLTTWLYKITTRCAIDKIRKQTRMKRNSGQGKDISLSEAVFLPHRESLDHHMDIKEQLEWVMAILQELPEKQQIAFTLSKIEGFSNPEIAEIMETTVVAVESLVYRSRKTILDRMKQLNDNDARKAMK